VSHVAGEVVVQGRALVLEGLQAQPGASGAGEAVLAALQSQLEAVGEVSVKAEERDAAVGKSRELAAALREAEARGRRAEAAAAETAAALADARSEVAAARAQEAAATAALS
jgi:hypothetical protein